MVFFFDQFESSEILELESRDPDIGLAWQMESGSNSILLSSLYSAFRSAYNAEGGSNSAASAVYWTATVLPDDVIIEVDLAWLGEFSGVGAAQDMPTNAASSRVRNLPEGASYFRHVNETGRNNNPVAGRGGTLEIRGRWDDGSGYAAEYDRSAGQLRLLRYDSLVPTVLATQAIDTDDLVHRLQLRMEGGAITLDWDGLEVPIADATYTSGTCAIVLDGGSSPIRGLHVAQFRAHDNFNSVPESQIVSVTPDTASVDIECTASAGATHRMVYRRSSREVVRRFVQTALGNLAQDFPVPCGDVTYYVMPIINDDAEGVVSDPVNTYVEHDGGAEDGTRTIFKAAKAKNWHDLIHGRICTKSGQWFPGSRIVYVNGVPVGDKYARPDPKPIERLTL